MLPTMRDFLNISGSLALPEYSDQFRPLLCLSVCLSVYLSYVHAIKQFNGFSSRHQGR